jgi:hypothetical protein
MTLQQFLEWLEATAVGVMIKESAWGFPITVALHIMGIMLSVGTLVWFDLRLLGVSMTGYRASTMYRRLMPWMFTGFALMFVTGGCWWSPMPRPHMAISISASRCRRWCSRRSMPSSITATPSAALGSGTIRPAPPTGARVAGLVSICVWATVIIAGRMMSYTMF